MTRARPNPSTAYALCSMLLALSLPLSAGIARGQSQKAPPHRTEATYAKVTHFDFDNDKVEGSIQQPQDTLVNASLRSRKEPLVRARVNFVPEMIKSVEMM